jgi:tetratricopeptide (TPR) repeat protein
MSLRSRSLRRLAILLAGLLVLVGIAAALYWRNEHLKQSRLAAAREAGMAAFRAGDYRATLEALKTYVSRRRDDNEALYAYGVARARIEEPNGRNIAEGITVFTTLLQQDPDNARAQYDLLDLYTQAFYNNEAIDLADRILARSPDDVRALKAKCVALDRQHKDEQALAISRRLNELDPADFEQQLATFQLMRSLKTPPAAVIARAEEQLADHKGDPRFELLAALAHGWSGDAKRGKELLQRAATRPAPDATYVRYMVRVLDSQRMYREAEDVLDRAAAQKGADPDILRILAQRLWQGRRYAQVLQRLQTVSPDTGDTDLLAYRAMALFDSGKTDQARQLVAALARRTSDSGAIAWSAALPAWFDHLEPRLALEKYRAALDRAPDNAVIRYLVGEAYARLGERDLAVQSWRRAAELSPSWSAPHVQAARTLAAAGRTKEAVTEAQLGFVAAPDAPDAAVALAVVEYRALEQGELEAGREAALLALVKKIQEVAPGEPETLPVYVSLLARAGQKDHAIAAVRAALTGPAKPNQATLLRLISASRAQGLGQEDDLQ